MALSATQRGSRRWQARTHMMRRLKEDRNQHGSDRSCPCWWDPKFMAHFREQPKLCSCALCGNPRRYAKGELRLTIAERRALYRGPFDGPLFWWTQQVTNRICTQSSAGNDADPDGRI